MDKPIDRFIEAIESQISYFSKEYSLSIAEAIGALELIKQDIINSCMED